MNRLPYMGTADDMASPDIQMKNRNRNKVFDSLSRHYGETSRDTVADNRFNGIQPETQGRNFHDPRKKFGESEFGLAHGTRTMPAPVKKVKVGGSLQHYVNFQSDFMSDKAMSSSSVSGLDYPIGQVGGVATDNKGGVYVFHRGNRVWDGRYIQSFVYFLT
ncbi:uncharacterized protein LOC110444234 isoform X1 [Mizuhopecten yessoensis]|uniref:uncharacterized protein LOC110444234 isoform X1 n=1 Tax=Mizuhopecten yessoensis TaxID=6573 RepID=UPI000B45CE0F|nr:uncharacterized protein LOC110444234 isoform X1 [Mizuhopecten yessoensis]